MQKVNKEAHTQNSSTVITKLYPEKNKSFGLIAILGAVSGAFMEGILHPIDTITTRLLVNSQTHVSFLTQAMEMYKCEGSRSFLRGFTCTLSGSLIANGVYFYSYEKVKYELIKHKNLSETLSPFLAGFVGGLIADFIYLPFDVIRTRMQLKPGEYNYKHVFDGFIQVRRHEGVKALYLGGSMYFALSGVSTSLIFGFYEILQKVLKLSFKSKQELDVPITIVSSACAASLAAFLTNPLDVLVTRMQSVNTTIQAPHSVKGLIKMIYYNEGPMGFMKGVTGNVLSYIAGSVILLPTYEIFKAVFNVDLKE